MDWNEKYRHILELLQSYIEPNSKIKEAIISESELPELAEYIIQEFKGEDLC